MNKHDIYDLFQRKRDLRNMSLDIHVLREKIGMMLSESPREGERGEERQTDSPLLRSIASVSPKFNRIEPYTSPELSLTSWDSLN